MRTKNSSFYAVRVNRRPPTAVRGDTDAQLFREAVPTRPCHVRTHPASGREFRDHGTLTCSDEHVPDSERRTAIPSESGLMTAHPQIPRTQVPSTPSRRESRANDLTCELLEEPLEAGGEDHWLIDRDRRPAVIDPHELSVQSSLSDAYNLWVWLGWSRRSPAAIPGMARAMVEIRDSVGTPTWRMTASHLAQPAARSLFHAIRYTVVPLHHEGECDASEPQSSARPCRCGIGHVGEQGCRGHADCRPGQGR